MEFLVVDGGSTDGTQAIVLAFSKKHLKFKKSIVRKDALFK